MEDHIEPKRVKQVSYHHNGWKGCTMLVVYVHHDLQDRQAELIAMGMEHALTAAAKEAFDQWSR